MVWLPHGGPEGPQGWLLAPDVLHLANCHHLRPLCVHCEGGWPQVNITVFIEKTGMDGWNMKCKMFNLFNALRAYCWYVVELCYTFPIFFFRWESPPNISGPSSSAWLRWWRTFCCSSVLSLLSCWHSLQVYPTSSIWLQVLISQSIPFRLQIHSQTKITKGGGRGLFL